MSDQFSSANSGSVTVFIYERELDFLKWLVLQKREIETGGDLFGLWQDERTAVVQFILGPGEGCRRTTTSFHQDVTYLGEVGGFLTSSQGLCNIGEWHSHHTLGLAEPSYGDQQTVWNNISSMAGGRFLVFIANIRGTEPMVNIGCFLFNWSQQEILRGNITCLPLPSPVRMTIDNAYITSKAERTQDWRAFMKCQASMQRNNKPVVDRSTPRDGNSVSNKSSTQKPAKRKARNGSANTKNRDPSITTEVSNGPKGGGGSQNTSSTQNGSLSSENDDFNAQNGKTETRDRDTITNVECTAPRNGNSISDFPSTQIGNMTTRNTSNGHPSTSNTESHTSKDDNGISNIPSTHNSNLQPGAKMKNSKASKKGNQVKKRYTTSRARKGRSKKKSRKKRDEQEETNEDDYGEEDTLLSVDESEEQELSKCGKICKRLREFFTTVRNLLRPKICGCC